MTPASRRRLAPAPFTADSDRPPRRPRGARPRPAGRPRRAACGRDDCRARASRRRWRRARVRRRRASASGSACGSPARSCQPSPTISSSRTSTAPTRGFGCVLYRPRAASSSARRMADFIEGAEVTHGRRPSLRLSGDSPGSSSSWSSLGMRAAAMAQPLDLLAEGLDVLEVAVHRGEAHVGHFVELVQLFHHELADLPRGHFALAEAAQLARDAADRFLDRFARSPAASPAPSACRRAACSRRRARAAGRS